MAANIMIGGGSDLRIRRRLTGKTDEKVLDGYLSNAFIGYLTAEEVKALSGTLRITVEELCLALLPRVAERAVVPLSGYRVGAIARGAGGHLYFGANIEFADTTITSTVHAEQAAVSFARSRGETGLKALCVTTPPCGLCRQFLYDIAEPEALMIQWPGIEPRPLSTLLPDAFGPADLNIDRRLFEPTEHPLVLKTPSDETLIQEALAAAKTAYAPYSGCKAGVAIETDNGRYFRGAYIENAAYNPSLPPLQAALVNLLMSGGHFRDIRRAALVQVEGTRIDQAPSTLQTLQTISRAPLSVAVAIG
jgi:cytidine deaminase